MIKGIKTNDFNERAPNSNKNTDNSSSLDIKITKTNGSEESQKVPAYMHDAEEELQLTGCTEAKIVTRSGEKLKKIHDSINETAYRISRKKRIRFPYVEIDIQPGESATIVSQSLKEILTKYSE
ncbi:MAG: hypothetical protein LBF54_03430 [Holosporaceae bacterium]|nr:hypothetical protein [Holosporaceae bacterium]